MTWIGGEAGLTTLMRNWAILPQLCNTSPCCTPISVLIELLDHDIILIAQSGTVSGKKIAAFTDKNGRTCQVSTAPSVCTSSRHDWTVSAERLLPTSCKWQPCI